MSIYSGFGTRQQETHYNRTIEKVLYLLADNIIYTHLGGNASRSQPAESFNEEKWFKRVRSLYGVLAEMEPYKYLKPKFSETLKDLIAAFSDNYSRENSAVGTQDLSMRSNSSFAFGKFRQDPQDKQQPLVYHSGAAHYLGVPVAYTTSKKPPRPMLNFPHSGGRNPSLTPSSEHPRAVSHKNSAIKLRQNVASNTSAVQNLDHRFNLHDVEQALSVPPKGAHGRSKSRRSQPDLLVNEATPTDMVQLRYDQDMRTRSKRDLNQGASNRYLAKSGALQGPTSIRFSKRKLKSAGRMGRSHNTGQLKNQTYVPGFSRETSGTGSEAGGSRPLKIRNQDILAQGGRAGERGGDPNDLQDASLEEISNFLIEKHEQRNAINFFQKGPERLAQRPKSGAGGGIGTGTGTGGRASLV